MSGEAGLLFTVPGEPVPKMRPRVVNGRTYTPKKTFEYEESVAWQARAAGVKVPPGCPLVLTVTFYITPRPRQKTPDTDNLIKSILDGLQMSGAISDDVDVVEIHAVRLTDADNPRAEVSIERVQDWPPGIRPVLG